jgi:hypothetical protein
MGTEYYSILQDRERRNVSDEEVRSRMGHSAAVGLTGAAAGLGTAYIIGKFTAGGAGIGAAGGGVGAVPGAIIGFIVGVVVAAGASYAASRIIPGSREDWERRHAADAAERARREAEERARQPLATLGGAGVPLPFRLSPDITPEEQIAIASWFIAQARDAQLAEARTHYDPSQMVCDPDFIPELMSNP